jgi:hypothetical protein
MPVLESILVSELDQIHEAGLIDEFLSDTNYDSVFSTTTPTLSVPWSGETAALHHWAALESKIADIESLSVDDALSTISDWLDTADALRSEAEGRGVQFEPPSGDHLDMWRRGIEQFRDMAELS